MMMSINELFYGAKEDVWVVKPEKKEEVKKGEAPPKPPPPTALEESFGPFFPYYHPPYAAPPAGPPAPAKKPAVTKKVELKVEICCTECTEQLAAALSGFEGVKLDCDIPIQKVIATVKNDTSVDDLLLECRKIRIFRKSRLWTKDD